MAQSSFPQCRREGVQYRISTTENAQEEIWYSQNEIPLPCSHSVTSPI